MKKLLFLLFIALSFGVNAQTASTPISATITKGDGAITQIQWSKVSGPSSFKIATPNQATTVVSDLVEGVYRFQLFVKDENGFTDTKFINVTVLRSLRGPVIIIEEDKTIRIPNT